MYMLVVMAMEMDMVGNDLNKTRTWTSKSIPLDTDIIVRPDIILINWAIAYGDTGEEWTSTGIGTGESALLGGEPHRV
jgi:hypothetical protein